MVVVVFRKERVCGINHNEMPMISYMMMNE